MLSSRNRALKVRYLPSRALFSALPSYEEQQSKTPRRQTRLHNSHQRGYGKIVANSSKVGKGNTTISTHLTELSHASPMRLVPSRRSHPKHMNSTNKNENFETNHEAAIVHLSSYGGGYVPGDIIQLDVEVRGLGAILYVLTQGGTRIYRPGDHFRQHSNYNYLSKQQLNGPQENSSMAKLCRSTINCTIEPGATLFYLPDPTVPYLQTSFEERRVFNCQYSNEENKEAPSSVGSIISVDWYGSGRRHSTGMEDERWAFEYLSTRMELHVTKHQQFPSSAGPVLIESLTFDNTYGGKDANLSAAAISMGKTHDSYATLLLHGPNSLEVTKRANVLSKHLASLQTRVRQDNYEEVDVDDAPDEQSVLQLVDALGGKVLMSVAPIENTLDDNMLRRNQNKDEPSPLTHMVRILAESNEDIYRVLHFCLKPCSRLLGGIEPYKDRIHSSATVRNRSTSFVDSTRQRGRAPQRQMFQHDLQAITSNLVLEREPSHRINDFNTADAWFTCLFSDSSLPVGSFAHSLGTEAASQMGLFNQTDSIEQIADDSSCSMDALADYIYSVSRSNARVSAPIILSGYALIANSLNTDQIHQSWLDIDNYTDTLLKSNGPGRRASIDQGLGFLRIAPALLKRKDLNSLDTTDNIWHCIRDSIDDKVTAQSLESSMKFAKGHAAPIYGILAAILEVPPLDACKVFAFGGARDSVSAAVRLNLLGPVAGLSVLNQVGRKAVDEGLEEGLMAMFHCTDLDISVCDRYKQWLDSASTSAPLMDVIHPCHDLLSVRLFRT